MSSELASYKKKNGHFLESEVALRNGGIVVNNSGKIDVIEENGLRVQVKGGKKTQWSLLSENTVLKNFVGEQKKTFQNYFSFLPDDKTFFFENRNKFKNNPFAEELLKVFENDYFSLIYFFCGCKNIDVYNFYDTRDNSHIRIEKDFFTEKIKKSIVKVYITKGGKLVFSGGKKNTILFELELRKGTNHKKLLFHSPLHRIIDLFK